MTTYTLDERVRLKDDVDRWRADAQWFERQARAARDDAIELRRVARLLSAEVDPLRRILLPVTELHTLETWEGTAASASRRRLDGHEGRRAMAVRTLDAVVADLEAEAGVQDKVQVDNESWSDSRRANASWLASQIGYYNGVLL